MKPGLQQFYAERDSIAPLFATLACAFILCVGIQAWTHRETKVEVRVAETNKVAFIESWGGSPTNSLRCGEDGKGYLITQGETK